MRTTSVLQASPGRVTPRCPHFGTSAAALCDQHADARTQMPPSSAALGRGLARIGKVRPETMLPIVYGEAWGYRRRARLSVRRVDKKDGVLVGFRERRSTWVADMNECPVLPPEISALIGPLKDLIEKLSVRSRLPQVEVAAGDNATALVFRHLLPLTAEDLAHFGISRFRKCSSLAQSGGPETVQPFRTRGERAVLRLSGNSVCGCASARPTHSGQFRREPHAGVARGAPATRSRAERIADLFCGLGISRCRWRRRGGAGDRFRRQPRAGGAGARECRHEQPGRAVQSDEPFLQSSSFGISKKLLIDPPPGGAIEI